MANTDRFRRGKEKRVIKLEQQFSHLISQYGYFGIFAFLAVGIFGLPLPDEMLMTFVGYTVYQGKMSFVLALASAFCGAVVGITISYLLGLKLGLPFLKKFGPKIHITEEKIERTHLLFEKYGNLLIFVGYFIPGVRHITGYIAGISNIGIRKFGLFAYSGALIWSFTFIGLGHELGERWFIVQQNMHRYSFYIPLILIGLVGLGWFYLKIQQKKKSNPL